MSGPFPSGRIGYATPRVVFRPRATCAIHGAAAVGSLGKPVSHGGVRLASGATARLFAMVERKAPYPHGTPARTLFDRLQERCRRQKKTDFDGN